MPFDRLSLFLSPLELGRNDGTRRPGQACILAALLALSAGCSSRVELGGSDAALDAGDGASDSGVDSSDANWSPLCPKEVPVDGSACTVSELTCEYGDSPEPACNTIAQCILDPLKYLVTPPDTKCPLPAPHNAAGCPSTYAELVASGPNCLDGGALGGECWYSDGQCDCFAGPTGTEPAWRCTPQPAGCPASAPRMGTACSTPGILCNYYSCQIAGAEALCAHGVWQGGAGGCVMPAIRAQ